MVVLRISGALDKVVVLSEFIFFSPTTTPASEQETNDRAMIDKEIIFTRLAVVGNWACVVRMDIFLYTIFLCML